MSSNKAEGPIKESLMLDCTQLQQRNSLPVMRSPQKTSLVILAAFCVTALLAPNDATARDVPFIEHAVAGEFGNANTVYTADVDGDGDMDMLGAAYSSDEITWWENRGGQLGLATIGVAPSTLFDRARADVLEIEMGHNGRAGDSHEELVTLELLFEELAGAALTSAQAEALIENLHLYLDTGDGLFDSATDTLVTTVSSLTLSWGADHDLR